jgi:hypothetical protein
MEQAIPLRARRTLVAIALAVVTAVAFALVLAGGTRASAVSAGTVVSGYKDTFHLVTGPNQQVTVGALRVPPGAYSISAKLYATVPLPQGRKTTIRCVLDSQQGDFDQTIVDHDGRIANVSIALNVVHSYHSRATVLLRCGHDYTRGDTYLKFVKITAISTDSLVNRPLP